MTTTELPAALNADAIATTCVGAPPLPLPVEQYESNPRTAAAAPSDRPASARSLAAHTTAPARKAKTRTPRARPTGGRRTATGSRPSPRSAPRRTGSAARAALGAARGQRGRGRRPAHARRRGPATVPTPALEDESDAGGAAWSLASLLRLPNAVSGDGDARVLRRGVCPACASLNFEKRTQTADLTGRARL